MLNTGTLIDATIIEAPRGQRRRRDEGARAGANGGGITTRATTADPCAT